MLTDFLAAVYKKHHPPSLSDEVWRLEKIGKDGAFHKRLSQEKIKTVEDFLRHLNLDSAKLRSVIMNYYLILYIYILQLVAFNPQHIKFYIVINI